MIKHSAPVLLMILVLFCTPVRAQSNELRTVSPSWQEFTSPQGEGLYHDLVRAVFTPAGYSINHVETPAKRGMLQLREGTADMYMCLPEAEPGLMLSAKPMYEGTFHAFFLTRTFPDWKGMRSLHDRTIACILGYYSARDFSVPVHIIETRTGPEALLRVLRGEADAYVDDRHLIEESIAASSPMDMSTIRIDQIGFRAYYPAFANTERGRELRSRFDQGMQRLAQSNRLAAIYAKWRLPMPRCYKQ